MSTNPSRSILSLGLALALACSASERTGATTPPEAQLTPAGGRDVALCSPSGSAFCWLNPLPQGTPIVGLAAAGGGAWGVGGDGAALRWNGLGLETVALPSGAALRAVWASAEGEAWAAGDVLLHHDGRAWSVADAPAAAWSAIHGSSGRDVWVVGAEGAAAHFDGTSWTRVVTGTQGSLVAVAAASASEAWAAASDGAVLRWDGVSWTPAPRLAMRTVAALLAAAPGDVWAAGEALPRGAGGSAALARLVGGAWEPVAVPGLLAAAFSALGATADGVVFAAGTTGAGDGAVARFDGAAWTVELLPAPALPVRAIRALPGGDVLSGGDGGQVFVRRGGEWSPLHRGPAGALQSAAVSPGGEVWFGAIAPDFSDATPQASLVRLAGGAVEVVPTGVADVIYGVWANASDDVWAGTLQNGFLHWDGQRWMARYAAYAGLVDGVWASGPADVWGAAGPRAVHFDGERVTEWPLPGDGARRIFGLSPRDVWAVGAADAAYHFDGARWTSIPIAGGPGLAVWGSAADDVWVVGAGGLALHWDGRAFARVETGTRADLWAVGGARRGDVWAAGADGAVVHLVDGQFEGVASGTSNALGAIAIGPSGAVYLAGDFGTILWKRP